MFVTAAICAILALLWWVFIKNTKKGRLPPEVKGNFFLGSALQLDWSRFTMQLAELGRNFGDAYTVRVLTQKYVFLNSYELIKEAIQSPKYATLLSGRCATFGKQYALPGDLIFSSYSKEWEAHRKLAIRGLKTYGTHLKSVECLVQKELEHFLSRIRKDAGKPVDPSDFISGYIISIISMLLSGEHLKQDDPRIRLAVEFNRSTDVILNPINETILTVFPWLRLIPFGLGPDFRAMRKCIEDIGKMTDERRKVSTETGQSLLDYMMEEERQGRLSTQKVNLIIADLFGAGSGTSRSTMRSMLPLLASRPDIQTKIQEEIDEEIGRSRLPCAEDKHRMPYTEAVLWETLRLYPAVPLAAPRACMDDVEIADYLLPEDTPVFYNIWGVLHDEDYWKNPWEFDPSRFLDDDGHMIPPEHENRERMIAFGLGKRACIGEVLARLRIFMALCAILQNYTLVPDPASPLPDLDPRKYSVGLFLAVPDYKLIFQPRCS